MKREVNNYPPEFKLKLVLEALKQERTMNEIASNNQVNPKNIQNWRKTFLEKAVMVFEEGGGIAKRYQEKINHQAAIIDELYRQIGQLSAEIAWAKKKSEQTGLINKTEFSR